MKKNYTGVEIEIIKLSESDVITTSSLEDNEGEIDP